MGSTSGLGYTKHGSFYALSVRLEESASSGNSNIVCHDGKSDGPLRGYDRRSPLFSANIARRYSTRSRLVAYSGPSVIPPKEIS